MKDKSNILWAIAVIGLMSFFVANCLEGRKLKAEVQAQAELTRYTQSEIDLIMTRLDGLADDCVVNREWYGFSCKEIKSGKVFKVAK